MSKNNENKLVPELRFPEFINDGNWGYDSVANLVSTITPPKKLNSSEYLTTGKYPIVDQSQNYYCGWTNDIDALLNKNLPLIVFGDHTCILKLVDEPFAQGADGIKIIKPNNTLTTEFLFQHLNFNGVKQDGYKRHYSILKEKIVSYPNINTGEQQKIAECLSSLDKVITYESQKLEVLNKHKRGLLQNLLPQAGETVPKFRFNQFEDSGDWEETTLTQVADYENGKAHEQDIADDGEFIVVNSKFISQDGEVKKFTNTAFLPATKGDVLMVLSDIPNGKAIAKCFLVEEDNRYTVNQRICRITPRDINSKILYYLLNRNQYFLAFDDGVKQTNLRKEDVLNCPLMIPEDPKEQEKIADTLSSVDDLINAQNQKLEALQLHKKGLLQGLFPNVNEVTA